MTQIIYLFVYLIISSLSVNASVVLNEVAIQPNQVIELYNTASTSADISSWYIDDAGGSTYYTIPSQTILAPKSCISLSSDFNFNKASADVVRLFDNTGPPITSSAKLVESYSYSKAPDASYSFSKKTDGGMEWQTTPSSLGLSNESGFACIPTPSPTPYPTETPIPTTTTTPSPSAPPAETPTSSPIEYKNIYISEVHPYPQSNEHEWVELYNDNDGQVNLNHWFIDDGEDTGSTPKTFSLAIDPYSYVTVDIASSLFNNAGDVARLLNNNKEEKDSMEYGNISQGKSMGRISFLEDTYCEQEPSKNSSNTACLGESNKPFTQPIQTIVKPVQKTIAPSKKPVNAIQEKIYARTNYPQSLISPREGEVLGTQAPKTESTSPTPYLSFVSASYSLLTIVSLFIKMKNA